MFIVGCRRGRGKKHATAHCIAHSPSRLLGFRKGAMSSMSSSLKITHHHHLYSGFTALIFNHTKILGPFFKHHPVLSSCFSFSYTTLSHHPVCCFYTAPCLILFIQHPVSSPCSSFSYTILSHIVLVVFIHHPILSRCSSFSYTTLSHLPAHPFHTPPCLIALLIIFIHHPFSSPCLILFIQHPVSSPCSSFSYTILSHIVLVVFIHHPILSPCSSFPYTTLPHHLAHHFHTPPFLISLLILFIHHPVSLHCSSFSYTTLSHLPAHPFHTAPCLIALLILFIHHPVSSPCSLFSYTTQSHHPACLVSYTNLSHHPACPVQTPSCSSFSNTSPFRHPVHCFHTPVLHCPAHLYRSLIQATMLSVLRIKPAPKHVTVYQQCLHFFVVDIY